MKLLRNIKFAIAGLLIASSSNGFAQLGPNGCYLMGTLTEIGIHPHGHEGTWDIAGSNSRSNQTNAQHYFGFVANPQNNGWTTYDGDFFTPGSAENGFGIQVNGMNYSNNASGTLYQIPGGLSNYQQNGPCQQVDWNGNVANVQVAMTYRTNATDLFYTTDVTLTNTGGTTLNNVYFYRNIDPDNNVMINGTNFATTNTIEAQPTPSCSKALVSATQSTPWASYVGIGGIDSMMRVSHGGFANRDGANIWNGIGFNSALGATTTQDQAISMAYKAPTLAPGESKTFSFVIVLNSSGVDDALASLYYFDYAGGLGAPTSSCVSTPDTAITCPGLPVMLDAQGPNVNDYTWSWSPAGTLNTSIGDSVWASPWTTTTYTLTGTPASSCVTNTITRTIVVDVSGSLNAGADSTAVICNDPGSFIDLNDLQTASGGAAGSWYDINVPPTGTFDTSTAIFTAAGLTPTDYYFIYVSQGTALCPDDTAQFIIEVQDPAVNAGVGDSVGVCPGAMIMDVGALIDPTADTTGFWFESTAVPSGQFNPMTQVFDANGLPTGIYSFNYQVDGCSSSDSAVFYVVIGPVMPNDSSTTLCNDIGNSVIVSDYLNVTTPTGMLYEAVPSGQYNAATTEFDVSALTAGNYLFNYITPSPFCVNDTAVITVVVTDSVYAGLDSSIVVCYDANPVDMNNLLNNADPGGTWSEVTSSGAFNAATGVFTPSGQPNGIYHFQYWVPGCIIGDTADFTVEVGVVVSVDAGQDVEVCDGESVVVNGTGGASYAWNNGVTDGISFVPPVTDYYVVVGTDLYGCTSEDSLLVTVHPNPQVSFIADTLQGCIGTTINFVNTTPGVVLDSCIWTVNGQFPTGGCGQYSHTFNDAGLYDIALWTMTNKGCTGSANYSNYIYIEDYPDASFSASNSVFMNLQPENVDFINTSTGATTYIWDFGDGSAPSDLENPSHTYFSEEEIGYIVEMIAYSPIGCPDTAYGNVLIQEELLFYIPNAFTPDGDEHNQTFKPVLTSGFDQFDYNMLIFNRWGEVIFETNDVNYGWDGTYNGKMMEIGTYVWRVEFNIPITGDRHVYNGHFTLLK